MATWSLCGRHVGPGKSPTPVFINLDNVLTVDRQDDLTTVVMVGAKMTRFPRQLSAPSPIRDLYNSLPNPKAKPRTSAMDTLRLNREA